MENRKNPSFKGLNSTETAEYEIREKLEKSIGDYRERETSTTQYLQYLF